MEVKELKKSTRTAKSKRPSDVKVVCVVMFFVGIPVCLAGFVLMSMYPLSARPLDLGFLFSTLLFFIGVAHIVVASSLWVMKPWARDAALITIIFGFLTGIGLIQILALYRLHKTEVRRAFGDLGKDELRKVKRICEGCGAKDVLLHELEKGKGFKYVCYECLKKTAKSPSKGE